MITWLRGSPGLSRVGGLTLLAALIALIGARFGQPVAWGTASIYGGALAIAMRWPIVMPQTGVRVVLLSGLILQAGWRYGLPTVLVLLCVEFSMRMLVLYSGRYYWEWYRPLFVMLATSAAYGLAVLVAGGLPDSDHLSALTWFEFPIAIFSFGFWVLLNGAWTSLKAQLRQRNRVEELLLCLQQTWWAPLAFLLVAAIMDWFYRWIFPVEILACIGLLWVHSRVGPVFTTIHQDRAAAEMIRELDMYSSFSRGRTQQVLHLADTLARSVPLSADEIRLLGYAAWLQDPPVDEPVPLWLSEEPTPEERLRLGRLAELAALRVERDGALQEVAGIIRHRYAAYDGSGVPAVEKEAIPLAAQVLGAANAVAQLMERQRGLTEGSSSAAVQWLRTHAANRFSPRVLGALIQAYDGEPLGLTATHDLPQTVRRLQGLVLSPSGPSTFTTGLRRIWNQFRGQPWMVQELPPEVQAVGQMATLLAASTESGQTAQIAVEAVGQLLGAKVFLAVRQDESDDLGMVVKATYGCQHLNLLGRRFSVSGLHLSRALLNQIPFHVHDMQETNSALAREMAHVEGLRSALFVPLVGRGRTIGMIVVCMQRYHWFTPRETGLIHMMAGQAAIAVENARLIAEAEERLAHISNLKAFNDTLLDNLSTSIVVVDPDCRVVMLNAAARKRFDGQAVQVGQPLPQDLTEASRVRLALQGESTPETDLPWGSKILEVQSVPLRDGSGDLLGAICLARDVTQVRLMEQQVRRVEKLAAVGELAAGAAHEIRNPLTSIRGFMQLMEVKAQGVPADYFHVILNEIDRIDGIIRDLLVLARHAEIKRVPTNLGALVEQVLLLNEPEFQRHGIELVCRFGLGDRPVLIDPKMIRQLLYNLLTNAVQAMPFGGTLTVELADTGSGQVLLAIADTGLGISPEHLQRLFIPFFTTKEEGTGLGLALCYSIVQAHNGRIDVESTLGVGSTFRIHLPVM